MIYFEIDRYISERLDLIEAIPAQRVVRLDQLSDYIKNKRSDSKPVRIVFICTHNSRRSQLAQVWSQVMVARFNISDVAIYSGGTEATAFNIRAVETLKRCGFAINRNTDDNNPIYQVLFDDSHDGIEAFSKVYDQAPNPREDFCAVMTCSSADADCPVVMGADKRISLPYDDPKEYDGTDRELDAYEQRCSQICIEMMYVFSRVSSEK